MPALWSGLALLAGCHRIEPVDVAATRRACGLEPDEAMIVLQSHRPGEMPFLSEECVRALGADIGLDWEEANTRPMALDHSESSEPYPYAVIYALFSVLVTPSGTITEELGQPEMPASLRIALQQVQTTNGFDPDLPASYLYYGLVAGRTRSVRFATERAFAEPLLASYNAGKAEIFFTTIPQSTYVLSSALVHEVMHTWEDHDHCRSTGSHTQQTTGTLDGPPDCDLDPDGTVGAQVWFDFRRGLMARCSGVPDPFHGRTCHMYLSQAWSKCEERIVDHSGYEPCDFTNSQDYFTVYDRCADLDALSELSMFPNECVREAE